MPGHRTFCVNRPHVASDLIDGEAVIMNLKSGNYFSTRQTGAVIWAWLEEGLSENALLSRVAAAYSGDSEVVSQSLKAFLAQLIEHELIVALPAESETSEAVPETAPESLRPIFKAPALEVFSDMRDLLLLDPIHDVTDAGWPIAKPTRPAQP